MLSFYLGKNAYTTLRNVFLGSTPKAVVRKRTPIAKDAYSTTISSLWKNFQRLDSQQLRFFFIRHEFSKGRGVVSSAALKNNSRKLNDPLEKQAVFFMQGIVTHIFYYYYFFKSQQQNIEFFRILKKILNENWIFLFLIFNTTEYSSVTLTLLEAGPTVDCLIPPPRPFFRT